MKIASSVAKCPYQKCKIRHATNKSIKIKVIFNVYRRFYFLGAEIIQYVCVHSCVCTYIEMKMSRAKKKIK